MRPINLIPVEQRRGACPRPGRTHQLRRLHRCSARWAPPSLCVLAVVLTSNQINSKTEELAEIQGDSQQEKQVADALRPYGQFADLQRARMTQIKHASPPSRFDWERPLRQLSRAIPRNVWLLTVAATGSPGVEVDAGGAAATSRAIREKAERAGVRDHRLHLLAARGRADDDPHAQPRRRDRGAPREVGAQGRRRLREAPAPAAQQRAQAQEDIQDCTGSARVTKFDMLVEFGGATARRQPPARRPACPRGPRLRSPTRTLPPRRAAAASAAAGGTTP